MVKLEDVLFILCILLFCLVGCKQNESPSLQSGTKGEAVPLSAAIERDMALLKNHRKVIEAFEYIEAIEKQTTEEHIFITEIPAPPFKEQKRAEAFLEMLKRAGADSVWIDKEGNAIALKHGTAGLRTVALAAHLDTVFPEGTPVDVEIRGDTLLAPGIGDDSRGLVEVLSVLKAINYSDLRTEANLLFIGTVGEEGLGDLRGVKYLFSDQGPGIDAWIAIDGGKLGNIVYKGLGSHRFRVTFEGPGGHSWGAFGLVNPHHALGEAIQRFVKKAGPFTQDGAGTSYNIGRIGGGTSVNAIPATSWMEVDLRSIDPDWLIAMDSLLHQSVYEAIDVQNRMRRIGPELEVQIEMIGNRPSGALNPGLDIIQRAAMASVLMGVNPTYSHSSTDSNIPIALGIPAITIGRGGDGGGIHSLNEWWVNDDAYMGIQWALLILLAEASLIH